MGDKAVLQVENLATAFSTEKGKVLAVDDVSFSLKKGETLGIVGESGCGKSVTALSLMRLLPRPAGTIERGRILLGGLDIVSLAPSELKGIRGKRIAMIFQEPMTCLNPVKKIGNQVAEVFQLHFEGMDRAKIRRESIEIIKKVGISDPEKVLKKYAHELSGGMRQRVMIAMALACRPEVLIADEPTTALDVTIQAQILDLIRSLQKDTGMSVIFITHDLGVIAEICDTVVVMYAGKTVENAPVKDLFRNPLHPYTRGLLDSIPRLDGNRKSRLAVIEGMVPALNEFPPGCRFQNRCKDVTPICRKSQPEMENPETGHFISCFNYASKKPSRACEVPSCAKRSCGDSIENDFSDTLMEVRGLKKHFPVRGGIFMRKISSLRAVDDVSLSIKKGETLGLVGESGCGKTTLGRTLVRLHKNSGGHIRYRGSDISDFGSGRMKEFRKNIQMIFQDPFESLNARHTVGEILEEPFIVHRTGSESFRKKEVSRLLERVGLPETAAGRFPHEFSGGQRQRIGIARAIALEPEIIICDEPVSALDVSIQSQILNLLLDLQRDMNLTCLFIAHDLSVVKHISDRIAVMYLGKIVELTDADSIYERPLHPYTRALISAIPVPDPETGRRKIILSGDVPSPVNPPSGCSFHPRCPRARDKCRSSSPVLVQVDDSSLPEHLAACHYPLG